MNKTGIGMLSGEIVYIWGQKYLTEVGNFVLVEKDKTTNKRIPSTSIEKNRMISLILSFVIVIVFWGV